jgi:hypothetical protein
LAPSKTTSLPQVYSSKLEKRGFYKWKHHRYSTARKNNLLSPADFVQSSEDYSNGQGWIIKQYPSPSSKLMYYGKPSPSATPILMSITPAIYKSPSASSVIKNQARPTATFSPVPAQASSNPDDVAYV